MKYTTTLQNLAGLMHNTLYLNSIIFLLILAVAYIDYLTGAEIRVYPFYFIPIVIASSWGTTNMGLSSAFICSAIWGISNLFGGTEFSHSWIWVWNIAIQGLSFSFIAYLISSLKLAKEIQASIARTDELTGLPNSRSFYDNAPSRVELCRRMSSPIVIAYIDLDNFKNVNDTYGHSRGDEILRIVSVIMKSNIREGDLLSRLGGDEFALLLPNTSNDSAHVMLERIRKEIEQKMKSEAVGVTASIGAVAFTNIPKDFLELINSADMVMYDIKNSKGNQVIVTQSSINLLDSASIPKMTEFKEA